MQSKYLRKFGFKKWQKFSFENETDLLACLPKGKGVYVIKHKSAFGRLKGKSDIVSFGSTTANEGG
jgi:hypothetical protein